MHPWTTARPPPFLPCHFWCIWKAPFPLQGGLACSPPSCLPGVVLGLSAFTIRSSIPTAQAEFSLQQGLVKDAGGLLAVLVPMDPSPGAEAGPPGDRRLHPQNSRIPPVCPLSALPAQTSSSLIYVASVFCLLTPSTILHPYQFRKNSEPKC